MRLTQNQYEQVMRSAYKNGEGSKRSKRVLIVDDDQAMLGLLEYSLKKLGSGYYVSTAMNSMEAMNMLEQQNFDIVLTDYMMPTLTGVDLARAIRRISPETRVVLMTAFGSDRLCETTKCLELDGYLNKPFSLEDFHLVVKRAANRTVQRSEISPLATENKIDHLAKQHLEALQAYVNAHCVMLLNSDGRPLHTIGQTDGLDTSRLSRFVAINLLATVELAGTLGSRPAFKSSYHEGDDYNICGYNVDGKYLLAVVFDARHKPGIVWFYTKKAATRLAKLIGQSI